MDVDDDAPFFLVHLLPVGEADWHSRAVAWLVMCDWSLRARSAAEVCGICGRRFLWHERWLEGVVEDDVLVGGEGKRAVLCPSGRGMRVIGRVEEGVLVEDGCR